MRTTGTALGLMLLMAAASDAAGDLTIGRKMTVGGTSFSTETLVKGSRERTTMDMGTGMPAATIRQFDLKQSLVRFASLGAEIGPRRKGI